MEIVPLKLILHIPPFWNSKSSFNPSGTKLSPQ